MLKREKRLWPTPLGEVVTGLMMDRFQDIIDVAFTAHMEEQLDQVEEGKVPWKQVLADFYAGFHKDMEEAEEALKDTRLKVPEEETDEVCELCGRKMVIKYGRFGRFLACPGLPRVQEYQAHRGADAGPLPQVRVRPAQAQVQAGLCLLQL